MACTIVDWQAVMREYELVRLNGYAMDREEATEGGICIGVPIRLAGSTVKSAISVSVPSSRMTAEREKEILEGLLSTANEVTGLLLRRR